MESGRHDLLGKDTDFDFDVDPFDGRHGLAIDIMAGMRRLGATIGSAEPSYG